MSTYTIGFLIIVLASSVAVTNYHRFGVPMLVVAGIGVAMMVA